MSCPAIGISESLSRSPSLVRTLSSTWERFEPGNPNKVIPSLRSQKSAESGVPAKNRQQQKQPWHPSPLGVSSPLTLWGSSPATSSYTVVSKRIGCRSCLPWTNHIGPPNIGQKTNKREGVWKRGGGHGGGWRGQWDTPASSQEVRHRARVLVFPRSRLAGLIKRDLSRTVHPPHAVGVELARALRLYQLATTHASTSRWVTL